MDSDTSALPASRRFAWRAAQSLVFLIGAAIFVALIVKPAWGMLAFWNVLIPVAPALLVFAPGLWRNICPLGSASLLARHAGLSSRRKLSVVWQGRLALAGVVLLLTIVPLRHIVLDASAAATGITLGVAALVAMLMGLAFEWKSGWCSSLCPVYPVERLYGIRPAVSVPNAHCARCQRCTEVCPDSTPWAHPLVGTVTPAHRAAGTLMAGGFVGFVWGWYQVPVGDGLMHVARAFGFPLAGLLVTLSVFLALRRALPRPSHATLIRAFAAAAVACYYWYRLPGLFGVGVESSRGVLIDLSANLPWWFAGASRAATTGLFVWWLVLGSPKRRNWAARPPFGAQVVPVRDEALD